MRSLGPVVVIIDEADAALGNRQARGDSGTSGRVFSMIARQMGNTDYRGRIIWMLLTSRPDLLPIDLKRQGRAEVHIPAVLSARCGGSHEDVPRDGRARTRLHWPRMRCPNVSGERGTERRGYREHRAGCSAPRVGRRSRSGDSRKICRRPMDSFIPSAQGLEKEMQELVAVLECTDREFLPGRLAAADATTGRPNAAAGTLMALREMIDD